MSAYYSENDPKAAAWLRELIARNLIAPGIVDDRSIADVRASDLAGFAQCHFFAGIGVCSYALRNAGWVDDRRVWTGSCPCQSFSAAGKGAAFDDPRHLWPVWFRLIRECRPDVVFGEQVSAAIRHDWLDLVSTDLEAEGYAIGSSVFGAHSVGAPHQRQRLWWVADATSSRSNGGKNLRTSEGDARTIRCGCVESQRSSSLGWLGNTDGQHTRQHALLRQGSENSVQTGGRGIAGVALGDAISSGLEGYGRLERQSISARWKGTERYGAETGGNDELADNARDGWQQVGANAERRGGGSETPRLEQRPEHGGDGSSFWSACDWLPYRDSKFRPVEPGTFPLAHGASARVGRLRGYGNAIVAEAATTFIEAYREVSEGAA